MKKINLQKIILISIFLAGFFASGKVFAATLELTPSKDTVGIGEQFYVDLMLDTEGQSINAIEGSIIFPSDKISYIRAEDGKSMINLWIDHPKLSGNTISFAGAISNGFDGVIDPFDLSHKLPGEMIRLVFEAENPGQADFSTSTFSMNLNDGLGTEITSPAIFHSVNIGDFVNKLKYQTSTSGTPELEAYVTRDPNIYNNKYVLVFKASDKETGIKNVMIKEGNRKWKVIESPYLLEDQSRHSTISLLAVNYSGGGIAVTINKIPYDWKLMIQVASVILTIIVFILIIIFKKKKYAGKKQ